MPRMPLCGGFRIGVDSIDPNTPPLVMVKVPPVSSSMEMVPSRAFSPYSAMAFSMPAKPRLSASRITGTSRPRSLETAIPMS
jgi:hypothetical protein